MSSNLIESVADQLSPPVTPVLSPPVRRDGAGWDEDGAQPSIITLANITILFASDDAD